MCDKYETGRALVQTEIEHTAKQLDELLQNRKSLLAIDPEIVHSRIEKGSLVSTDRGIFFISLGLGKIKTDNQEYFVISPLSPIGQQLIGKKIGDMFNFRNSIYTIQAIQ